MDALRSECCSLRFQLIAGVLFEMPAGPAAGYSSRSTEVEVDHRSGGHDVRIS